VAPFKAQNMSLNSFVTLDGAEIGRAQAMQAAAAGIEPAADMNPVLLKPGSDRRSQVVVLGHPEAEADAVGYRAHAPRLRQVALDSLTRLRDAYDVVICEGAGSPAEINLRDTDVANMGLARAAGLPVIVVGDIDRGGVFAAMYGTLALLSPADQALISGFVINKFRGAPELLDSGLTMLQRLTGRPVYGVLPWRAGLWLDVEDSLSLRTHELATREPDRGTPPGSFGPKDFLRVAVVSLPRISNFTDVDALSAEPGVLVRFAIRPADLADADLVVLPGSRATVADLDWLRDRGLADAVTERARTGRPVLGICGGYQMMASQIDDPTESRRGLVEGLGLLPVRVRFGPEKILGRPQGRALGAPVAGYEIHHGVAEITDPAGSGTERSEERRVGKEC
jgi:adenosylcobyric acid synthase